MTHRILCILLIATLCTACASTQSEANQDASALFLEFWNWVDENYIYFDEKDVDWIAVYNAYSAMISNNNTTDEELFSAMEGALLELRDSHNRLESPQKRALTHPFRQGYEIHFDDRLIKDTYVTDSLGSQGNLYWGTIQDSIGYIYLRDFNRYGAFRSIFEQMAALEVSKVIIDVRNNSGGDSNAIPDLLGILVTEETTLGSYIEKAGPAHDDVSDLLPIKAYPDPTFHFDIPVNVLINRGSYSATSYFAAMMKGLPNVKLVGQITGGGGGGNLGYQLSNGWLVAVSVSDFIDKTGASIEPGVEPDITIENTAADIATGRDVMLEVAME
jgi:C-terminal processing protease CtpA/Prc